MSYQIDKMNQDNVFQVKKDYLLDTLSMYWTSNRQLVEELPVVQLNISSDEELPPQLMLVSLPEWAHDCGVQGQLLVPQKFVAQADGEAWQHVDWFATIFWYLNNSAERQYEKENRTIHSYSARLKGWDERLWERAWVNRIGLFLRRWAAHRKKQDETELFGDLPEPKIILTHDVDAIFKTKSTRLKQAAFHLFNALRMASHLRLRRAGAKLADFFRFLFSHDNYCCFEIIKEMETSRGVKSYFNFYGGQGQRGMTLKEKLFDPRYSVTDGTLQKIIRDLREGGWQIGLHQSFDNWHDSQCMLAEKSRLEESLGEDVPSCRQHWLRFSFADTWIAQQAAGFQLDSTLGFNDRCALRNGSALAHHPWDDRHQRPMRLKAMPMVLMDSHLYDYQPLDESSRRRELKKWIDEIQAVHGSATVIWHQRVFSHDYDWGASYEYLLSLLSPR